jgi:hypothetical protein
MIRARIVIGTAVCMLLHAGHIQAQAPSGPAKTDKYNHVIEVPDAPVKITEYSSSYNGVESRYSSAGIHHNVKYIRTSPKEIMAVQVAFISFGLWNDFIDVMHGFSKGDVKPNKPETASWISRAWNESSHLTGVAFVSRVRFADDTIWQADERFVLDAVRKLSFQLEASALTPKPPSTLGTGASM